MSLKDAIASLRKSMGEVFDPDYSQGIQTITTGSIAVDLVTGVGGFPRGRLTEVSGWEMCLADDVFLHYTQIAVGERRQVQGRGPDSPHQGRVVNCKGGTIERLYHVFHGLPFCDKKGRRRQFSTSGSFFSRL
mgnify:CR=1 FL=1